MKILMALAALLLAAAPAHSEVVDKISIVVNDEIVTESEIQMAMHPIYIKYRSLYSGNKLIQKLEEARQKIAEQLIDDKLILSEAKRLNVEVDDREVDRRMDEVIKRMGSRAEFERAIAQQKLSLRDIRTRYKEQLMTRKLIDQKVGSRIMISPVEIAEYYDKNKSEFSQPEEIKLRNILISIKKQPNAKKASELAKEIYGRLKEGCDFAGLAKVYSDGPGADNGGEMGWVRGGYLLPEIDKVVFGLKEGETSEIIQTSLGYHIFRVEEKRPPRTLTLSETRRDIEEAIFKEKANEKIKGWVESLKKNAYIAFK